MFQINSEDLPLSKAFPYLGCTIAYKNSNWPAVYQNLRKPQRQWGIIVRVLAKMVATVKARGMMYKAVDQFAIFYGSES